jgi:hypothetical protein
VGKHIINAPIPLQLHSICGKRPQAVFHNEGRIQKELLANGITVPGEISLLCFLVCDRAGAYDFQSD